MKTTPIKRSKWNAWQKKLIADRVENLVGKGKTRAEAKLKAEREEADRPHLDGFRKLGEFGAWPPKNLPTMVAHFGVDRMRYEYLLWCAHSGSPCELRAQVPFGKGACKTLLSIVEARGDWKRVSARSHTAEAHKKYADDLAAWLDGELAAAKAVGVVDTCGWAGKEFMPEEMWKARERAA
jgi:hypothetical protein